MQGTPLTGVLEDIDSLIRIPRDTLNTALSTRTLVVLYTSCTDTATVHIAMMIDVCEMRSVHVAAREEAVGCVQNVFPA